MFDLKSIKKEVSLLPPAIVIYGSAGLGKTTFASLAPNPIFIPCEQGFGTLEVAKFPKINSIQDVLNALMSLIQQEHDFETVVIDTLDKMEKLIWAQVAIDQKKDSIESIGYAKGYIFALSYFEKILKLLDVLREEKGMAVIFTCHSLIKAFSPPTEGSDGYDVYQIDLHAKAAGMIKDWCDFILFLNYRVFTKTTDDKKVKAVNKQADRYLYTDERPAHWGKSRYNIPYEIEVGGKNSWDEFFNAYVASLPSAEPEVEAKPKTKKAKA